MRVRVDRETLAPLGIPEYLGGDKMMDDFLLDEDAGVAYGTTHRENPAQNSPVAILQRICVTPKCFPRHRRLRQHAT
jgi:hypothetical protein